MLLYAGPTQYGLHIVTILAGHDHLADPLLRLLADHHSCRVHRGLAAISFAADSGDLAHSVLHWGALVLLERKNARAAGRAGCEPPVRHTESQLRLGHL